MSLKSKIRTIPNYPKPGIMFRDITTLLADPEGFRRCVDELVQPYVGKGIDIVVGVEARGFILGGAVAYKLGLGFVPVRKKGKLPGAVLSQDYELEYGTDTLEVHEDAFPQGARVLVVDDLIATGGTALAAVQLCEKAGAVVESAVFVVDLPALGGRKRLEASGVKVEVLLQFEGE